MGKKEQLELFKRATELIVKGRPMLQAMINPEFRDEELLERLREGTPKTTLERALGTTHEHLTLPWED